MAFYLLLAVPSLAVLVLMIGTAVFGTETVNAQLLPYLKDRLPSWASELLRYLVLDFGKFDRNSLALGGGALIATVLGVAGFSAQIKESIETIWDRRISEVSIREFLGDQFWSIVLSVILATVVLLSVGTRIFVSKRWGGLFGDVLDLFLTGMLFGALSGLVYRIFSRIRIPWRDIVPGALFTSTLLILGREGLSPYLSSEGVSGLSGVAGSILIFLLWTYYFSQIFLLGAEFTRVLYRHRHGK